jgi:hypothetical protein
MAFRQNPYMRVSMDKPNLTSSVILLVLLHLKQESSYFIDYPLIDSNLA